MCATRHHDRLPYVLPACPAERSSLRWAIALDVDEDLTDDDEWNSSESDSDSESDWDSSDSELDSDSDDEEDEDEEPLKRATPSNNQGGEQVQHNKNVFQWKTQNVTTHEWTLPANKVLPLNLQTLFHQAAANPDFDIQRELHKALAAMPTAA